MRWLAIAPFALQASAACHPVEDQSYRYETVELRTADGAATPDTTRIEPIVTVTLAANSPLVL